MGSDSILRQRWFFLTLLFLSILSHGLDLIGTYIAQPKFEHEGNALIRLIQRNGMEMTWPLAIFGKALFIAFSAWAYHAFLRVAERYYPTEANKPMEVLTSVFYQRKLGFFETFIKLPKDWRPFLFLIGPLILISWPFFVYVGYENLAVAYGWPHPEWPYLETRVIYLHSFHLLLVFGFMLWLMALIWKDYLAFRSRPLPA